MLLQFIQVSCTCMSSKSSPAMYTTLQESQAKVVNMRKSNKRDQCEKVKLQKVISMRELQNVIKLKALN